jgi:hypothetical protein
MIALMMFPGEFRRCSPADIAAGDGILTAQEAVSAQHGSRGVCRLGPGTVDIAQEEYVPVGETGRRSYIEQDG